MPHTHRTNCWFLATSQPGGQLGFPWAWARRRWQRVALEERVHMLALTGFPWAWARRWWQRVAQKDRSERVHMLALTIRPSSPPPHFTVPDFGSFPPRSLPPSSSPHPSSSPPHLSALPPHTLPPHFPLTFHTPPLLPSPSPNIKGGWREMWQHIYANAFPFGYVATH